MRFSVLGPLAVEADDGSRLPLRRPSQRSTLAVLLLHAAQLPTRSLLIDALWGDRPPANAEAALRVRIRDLRRALATCDRLLTHPAGYHLMVRPGELDCDSFRALAGHGRAALDRGRAADAARLLAQACALWRDPPLPDLPDTPLMGVIAATLMEEHRDAREWLLDARLALGHEHAIIGQIRELIAADPLREHPYVQLMLALYRCGEKPAALAVYGRLRDLTGREFGMDPGPEARALLSQVLADGPALMSGSQPSGTAGQRPGRHQQGRRRVPERGRASRCSGHRRRVSGTSAGASGGTAHEGRSAGGPPGPEAR